MDSTIYVFIFYRYVSFYIYNYEGTHRTYDFVSTKTTKNGFTFRPL